MTTNPTSTLLDQWTAGWEQAQTAAQQWWDLSWTTSDQLRDALSPRARPAARRPGASRCRCGAEHGREHGHGHGHGHGHRGDPHDHGHDVGRHDHGHHEGHENECHHHDCCCADPCSCCVPEADIVLRVRAGERRVVPFTLRNEMRRDREVSLQVGPFHPCSGDELVVKAKFVEGEQLTMEPCEHRQVHLLVSAGPAKARELATGTAGRTKPDLEHGAVGGDVVVVEKAYADVERCSTAYADVRFEGCGRPMRLAVVVVPSECEAVDVPCGCGCCC